MSLIYIAIWVAVWCATGWAVRRMWKRWRAANPQGGAKPKVAVAVFIFVWIVWPFWEVAGKKIYWDTRVRMMCAEDGGVKVYETDEVPAEKYDEYTDMSIGLSDKSEAKPSDEYYYEQRIDYYHNKNPRVSRRLTKVVRRSDGKVLAESVIYSRGGGDFPGPWQGSYFRCPDLRKSPDVEKKAFVRGE